MKSIVMAGGEGTRLWPLSRKNLPKQFISINDEETFLEQTLRRLLKLSKPEDIYIVTQKSYKFLTTKIFSKIPGTKPENIILEPEGRNTAPAILLTIKYLKERMNIKTSELVLFIPADHIISPEEEFVKIVEESKDLACENITVFGIQPHKPETGYGYIELESEIRNGIFRVKRFVEKPSLEVAKEYIRSGNFLWNSGIFLFSIKTILNAFKNLAPDFYRIYENYSYEKMLENYSNLEKTSIDYAIMEKSKNIVCKKSSIYWNDIGNWESVYETLDKDSNNNAIIGDVITMDSKNNLIISKEKLTTLIGIEDLIIVESEDAILLCKKGMSQKVKNLVEILKEKNKIEAIEHPTVYRPWGSFTVLEEGPRYKIKKIIVNEGASLSLQRHLHRSEHWVVIQGTALVEVNNEKIYLHENESTFIPKSTPHRLSNPGKIPLEIIEVQNGEYVGEDDIERIEDPYNREEKL